MFFNIGERYRSIEYKNICEIICNENDNYRGDIVQSSVNRGACEKGYRSLMIHKSDWKHLAGQDRE